MKLLSEEQAGYSAAVGEELTFSLLNPFFLNVSNYQIVFNVKWWVTL
jgi:hypothetical protein